MSTPTDDSRLAVAIWTGRVVACFILILGSLVLVTFLETERLFALAFAIMGVGGALLYIIGLERSSHPRSRWVQLMGWLMMAGFSVIPTSLLFIPMIVVLFAVPTVFLRFQHSWYASGQQPSLDPRAR